MIKILLCFAFTFAAVYCEQGKPRPRLLFYDEEGNLVKTYSNPYLQNLRPNTGLPIYGSFLNPIFGFIKDFGSIFAFAVPVSNQVIHQINRDPLYHNQLMTASNKEPVIRQNLLCEGKRTQIPSPNLCNNYLNCWDGWAVEQECPSGLLFSNLGYCDYPDSVRCETRKLKEQPQTQPQCKKDFETFRNKLDCNEFFVCVNRQPVKFKCPAGLVYSEELGVCNYVKYVPDCSYSGANTETFADVPATPEPVPIIPAIPSVPAAPSSPAIIPPSLPLVPSLPISPSGPITPEAPTTPDVPITPAAPIVPAVPITPVAPIAPPAPIGPPISPQPAPSPILPILPPMPLLQAVIKPDDIQTIYSENSIVNTQSWTSTHIATSLQDAIHQLQRSGKFQIKNTKNADI